MELLEVVAKVHFENSAVGAVARKQRIRIPAELAQHLASLDLVTLIDPTPAVVRLSPKTEATELGGDEPQQWSQPVPASPKKTASSYRRSRKTTDGESSQ